MEMASYRKDCVRVAVVASKLLPRPGKLPIKSYIWLETEKTEDFSYLKSTKLSCWIAKRIYTRFYMCLSDSPLDDELISKTWEFFILGDFSAQTLDSIIEYTIYIVLISKVRQPSKTRTYISHSLQIQYSNKPFTLQWGNQISMQTTSWKYIAKRTIG